MLIFFVTLDECQQYKVKYEESGANPENRINFFNFALANLNEYVEYEACGYTVRNAVTESHENSGKECRNCFIKVAPVNVLKGGHHHNSDNNQCGCCCR